MQVQVFLRIDDIQQHIAQQPGVVLRTVAYDYVLEVLHFGIDGRVLSAEVINAESPAEHPVEQAVHIGER